MKLNARTLLAITVALIASTAVVETAAARPVEIAPLNADGMTAAEASVVWSSHQENWYPPYYLSLIDSTAELWRIDKNGPPGSQTRLYQEKRDGRFVSFGNVTYAKVGGVPTLFFVANYDGSITYIKRVPLAGGPATIVSRTPYNPSGDLKTDGAYLYWADSEGVRRMAVTGGAITTLFRSTSAGQIGLDDHYVYFNGVGPNGSSIHRTPKAGGAVTLQIPTNYTVTDMFVRVQGAQTTIYWSETSGIVSSIVVGNPVPQTYRGPGGDRIPRAVIVEGSRVIWSDCYSYWSECNVRVYDGTGIYTLISGFDEDEHTSITQLVADTSQVFWGGTAQVAKYVHTPAPSVTLSPASIVATREGRGAITRTLTPIISQGDGPFTFQWYVTNAAFIVSGPDGPASVWATLAACDSLETTVEVTVIDSIGRRARASAEVAYSATRPVGGVCD